MTLYQDPWRGFQLHYPDGWSLFHPPLEGIGFESPDGGLFLEVSRVAGADAMQALQHRLQGFPQLQVRIVESAPTRTVALFRHPAGTGQVRAQHHAGHVTLGLVHARPGVEADLNGVLGDTLASLQALAPIPRLLWQEPAEGSCRLVHPEGATVQWAFRPDNFGIRQPVCRVTLAAGTFVALEPEFHAFIQGPPQMFGDVSLPMRGLLPVLQGGFLPRWPGARLLEFRDFGDPTRAEARLQFPEGLGVAVLAAAAMPGSPRWVGGLTAFYQAPADRMASVEPILRGVMESYSVSPQWQQRQRQIQQGQFQQSQHEAQQWMRLQQGLHEQRMRDIQVQGAHNTAMHDARQQVADMQFQGFQDRMQSMDQVQHDSVNAIRGRSDYVDRGSGEVYNLAAGQERLWTDRQGHVVASDWGTRLPPDWHELEELPPGHWHPR